MPEDGRGGSAADRETTQSHVGGPWKIFSFMSQPFNCRSTLSMRREKLMDEDDGPGTLANFLEIAAFMGLLLTVATGVLMVVYAYL